jgi:indole-3-pyruvate monooxygenase
MPLGTDTLVVGASGAGLATVACLQRAGVSHEVLEAADVVGSAWRHHYDRLHLHTPRLSSALPGLRMPRDWPRYPSRDQVVDYLEHYCRHHGIAPRFGQQVLRLERKDGGWVATTGDGQWRARHVVVATGATRRPVRPSWPGMETYQGQVLHSSEYVNGEQWRSRPVLVVGFGNSACEQAIDLLECGALPHQSVRSPVNVIPRDLFGTVSVLQLGIAMRRLPPAVADALAWPLVRLTVGDLRSLGLRKLGYGPNTQIARDGHIPVLDIGTVAQLRAGRIQVHGAVSRFTTGGVVFADGTALDVDAVVLGTGYRPALEEFLPDWRAVCDESGTPHVSGRATALPGLYFCGQHVSPAGMLREIGLEARRIAADIAADLAGA